MDELFKWLSSNPVATITLTLSFGVLVISATSMYLVAFFEGRELSFWPPKIGEKPQIATETNTGKTQNGPPGSVFKKRGLVGLILVIIALFVGILISSFVNPFGDDSIFSIERGPVTAFLYQGIENPQIGQGTGDLAVTSAIEDTKLNTSYKLDYNLPKDGEGYAGVALWFPEPLDLTGYGFIELTISFGDDQARCRLFLKDSFGKADSVILGDGTFVSAKLEEQTLQIPLKNFSSVAKKSVREIDLDANNFFTQERHSFTVSKIQFRK